LVEDAGEINTKYRRDDRRGHAAWLDWPWKLHRIAGGSEPESMTIELYNLEADPQETTNVAAANPELIGSLGKDLETWRGSVIDSLNGKDYE
jgi:arylsulfatase A-like enzyme